MQFDFRKYAHHFFIILGFAVIAILFSLPAYRGMELSQGDTVSWKAASQEAREHNEKTGEKSLWSNNMFGGGPTYTYYLPDNHSYVSKIQVLVTGLVKKPGYFFFLSMLCFFICTSVLRINKWLGMVGSVAFAFTSFSVISIVAGHETKILSIAYMPAVFAGLILLFRGRYIVGGALFAASLTLMLGNGHWQIVYYTAFVILALSIGFLIKSILNRSLSSFLIASAVALVTGGIAAATSASRLLPTLELNKETMRGGKSELTLNKSKEDLNKKGGLNKDYAFQWSNAPGEVFCMLIPYLYGGGSSESAEKAPETAARFGVQAAPMYWGPQPFLAGPMNYVGAVVCFLFVLGMFVIRNRMKWIFFAMAVIAIFMSMGDHFKALNYFLFDHLPGFNSFRTPTMVHAIVLFVFPLIGIWGVSEIINEKTDRTTVWKQVKLSAGITAGLALLLGAGGSMFFDFTTEADKARLSETGLSGEALAELVSLLKKDRASLAFTSGITSAVYILVAAALVWAFVKDKIKQPLVIIAGLGLLVIADLASVNKNYLNEENYVEAAEGEDPVFAMSNADRQILADPDPYYRVLDISRGLGNLYNDAKPAYYHKLIGGYSPAKLEIYQDLIDMQMSPSKGKFNEAVLRMLNTKYIIMSGGQGGEPIAQPLPAPCGNGWFVEEVKWVKTADEEMMALEANSLGDTTRRPDAFEPLKTAVVRETFRKDLEGYAFGRDSAAAIKLTKYGLNSLSFSSSNSRNGLAVFSDIYYPHGWHAYIDGKETPIIRANYVLRAIKIPAGTHSIEFRFHPDSFYNGDRITLISNLLIILMIAVAVIMGVKNKNPEAGKA